MASPRLVDPNFDRTVAVMLEHAEQGALGLVLNRPGGARVRDVLPAWGELASVPAEVFVGGPVARNALIGLARLKEPAGVEPTGWQRIGGGVGVLDLATAPTEEVAAGVRDVRIFSGYAGWASGQVEAEIEEGAWLVLPVEERDVFSADPEGLWRRILRRQGGELAMLSGFPADLSAN